MTGRNISDYLMKTNYEFYKRRFGGKVSLYGVESFIWLFPVYKNEPILNPLGINT